MNELVSRNIGRAVLVGMLGLGLSWTIAGAVAPASAAPSAPAPQDAGKGQSQTPKEQGEAALARARADMEAGRYESAAANYAEALRLLPGNQEAIEGKREAETLMNRGSTAPQVEQQQQVLLEQARVEFDNAMARATDLLKQEDFEGAKRVVIAAEVKLKQSENLFRASEYQRRYQEAEQRRTEIAQAQEVAKAREEAAQAEAARKAQEQAKLEEQKKIESQIKERIIRVRQLQQARKYDEALQVVDEILFLDPQNPTALMLQDVFQSQIIYDDYARIQRLKQLGYGRLSDEAQAKLIPPRPNRSGPGMRGVSELMMYPEDWPGLSIMRTGGVALGETQQDRVVAQRLASATAPIDFEHNSFSQVVSFLEKVSGLTFYVDWKALNTINVDRDTDVTLTLAEVPISTALDRVLEQLSDGVDRPQYAIEDGVLSISSDEALRRHTTTVTYDIRDLLFEVPYFDNAPPLDLDSAIDQGGSQGMSGGSRGAGGYSGGGSFGGNGGGNGSAGGGGSIFGDPGAEPERKSRAQLVDEIVGIIENTVDADGWYDNGGSTGTIQEFNGNLIIQNTPRAHREIEGILSRLREIRAIQINVETRVLTVSTDWFEQIGVDLDLFFNTNKDLRAQQLLADPLAHLSDFFNPDGTLKDPLVYDGANRANFPTDPNDPTTGFANQIAYGKQIGVPDGNGGIQYISGPVGAPIRNTSGWSPIGVTQNSLSLLDLIGSATDFGKQIIGSGTPALVTGIQFLDDIQVDLLIEATQADQRTVLLTAPRLTFFNGQRAWIAVVTQQAFVSGLQAVTGDSSGAYQPIVSTLNTGFVLDVEAVVSADRRYVTINVVFDQATLLGFTDTAVFGAACGGGTGGGNAAQFGGTIQIPTISGSYIRTTVSVPDKGTVLLGGQRTVDEYETETGVPILSKIPFINRFFTNRLTSKDEKTLLFLIRPEIIIQQENEDILFPGLADTLGGAAASFAR